MARTKRKAKRRPRRPLSVWIARFGKHLVAANYSALTRRQYGNRLDLFASPASISPVRMTTRIAPIWYSLVASGVVVHADATVSCVPVLDVISRS